MTLLLWATDFEVVEFHWMVVRSFQFLQRSLADRASVKWV